MNTNNEAAPEQRPVKPIKPRSRRGRRMEMGDVPAPDDSLLRRAQGKPRNPYKKDPDYDPQEFVEARCYALHLYDCYTRSYARYKRVESHVDITILSARHYIKRPKDDERSEASPEIVQKLRQNMASAESSLAETRSGLDEDRRAYKEAREYAVRAYMMFNCQRQHDKSKDLDAEKYPDIHEPLPSV